MASSEFPEIRRACGSSRFKARRSLQNNVYEVVLKFQLTHNSLADTILYGDDHRQTTLTRIHEVSVRVGRSVLGWDRKACSPTCH